MNQHVSDNRLFEVQNTEEQFLKGFNNSQSLVNHEPKIRDKTMKIQKKSKQFCNIRGRDITRSSRFSTTNASSKNISHIKHQMNNSRFASHKRKGSLNRISNQGLKVGLENYIDEEKQSEVVTQKDPLEQKMIYSNSSDDEPSKSDNIKNRADPKRKTLENLYVAYGRKNFGDAKQNVAQKAKPVKSRSSISNK